MVLATASAVGCITSSDEPSVPPHGQGEVRSRSFPEIAIPYEKHVLPNGLTLIIHEDHKAPAVAVNVWYHVGSKDERPGRTGFAHLFEHLMYNGSENHDDEFFRPLEAIGATEMNGTTSYDRTNYFQNVPSNALDLALWLESDRMGHLLGAIDQEKLDEQRGVVQNEKREGENQPYGKAGEIIAANSWPAGHPYSWIPIGSMEDLNAASLEDVKEWFRNWYGAANAVLVVAGDVKAEEVKQKVELYFGDIPGGPTLRRGKRWVARMTDEKRWVLQDRVPQARLYKVWNIPGDATREVSLLHLAAEVLAGGKNGRLYRRLVHTERVATRVSASAEPHELAGQFTITADVKPGSDVQTVERAMDEELASFLQNGPTQDELDRIKMSYVSLFARSMERIGGFGGKSAVLAQGELLTGSPDFYFNQDLKWIVNATEADVQGTAKQWLSDGVFVLEVQPAAEYVTAQGGADRKSLPAAGASPDLDLPQLQKTALSNGLTILLAERHNAPLVQFQLILNHDERAEDPGEPGVAGMTQSMMDEGTATRSSFEIAAAAERLGTSVSGRHLNTLASTLSDSLELFSDILLNPTFPEEELERLKTQAKANLAQQKARPGHVAMRLFYLLLHGKGHPYAVNSHVTEQQIGAITREKIVGAYRRWTRPDNATLLIVGDTTLADIVPLLERYLGGWKAPSEPLPTVTVPDLPTQNEARVFLVNRTGAEQSTIIAGEPSIARSDADYNALETLNTVLGGSFVSRLNMNLREDKHWAYGAGSAVISQRSFGVFTATASVQTDKTAESIAEILKELRDLTGARPPTLAEIQLAKNGRLLSLPSGVETAQDLSGLYSTLLHYGLPTDYWNQYVGVVNALTPREIAATARKHLHPDVLTWVIVGDLAKIEDGIRKLNLGAVAVLDTDGNVVR